MRLRGAIRASPTAGDHDPLKAPIKARGMRTTRAAQIHCAVNLRFDDAARDMDLYR